MKSDTRRIDVKACRVIDTGWALKQQKLNFQDLRAPGKDGRDTSVKEELYQATSVTIASIDETWIASV
jgi:hypothetical protein